MTTYFKLEATQGVATLTVDYPGEKINKLSGAALSELSDILTSLSASTDVKVVVIRSGKPNMFIAGADISEIESITGSDDGYQKARMGQGIFDQIEALPFPSIAAIDGPALGGGLELALACTYRLVSDNPNTQLGLPEVNLGIIPGFGGTQRLPRLIGVQAALPLIISGTSIDGAKAEKMGLADRCVSAAFFDSKLAGFVNEVLAQGGKRRVLHSRRLKQSARWMESIPGMLTVIGAMARKRVMAKTHGHYPAPLFAIEAVIRGYTTSQMRGLDIEARCFSELVGTDISKNLIRLFFIQESIKKYTGTDAGVSVKPIRSGGVLGAGLMGGGIAWLLSSKSIPVRLKDIHWNAIGQAYSAASRIYKKLVDSRKLSRCAAEVGIQSISATTDFVGFGNCDVVIEAVVEDMGIKKNVIAELEQHSRSDTVIASNTSALSISEMATVLSRPERFLGMHFFSPVNRMPLVEIIPGDKTSQETIATIVQLTKALKKTPIVVKDCPGFLVNRILIPYVNEAVLLLEDGVSVSKIDQVMEQFGMPLGPLALADEVGLDVGYKVAKILETGYGSRMAVAESFERIHLSPDLKGKKTGKGFYIHTGDVKTVNNDLISTIKQTHGHPLAAVDIMDRLVLIMVNEAARCIEEHIVESPEFLDFAMVMGTGFPPFRLGLCRYADQYGMGRLVDRLEQLAKTAGMRFVPAPLLVKMANDGTRFYN